jgi:hypothetical protein
MQKEPKDGEKLLMELVVNLDMTLALERCSSLDRST